MGDSWEDQADEIEHEDKPSSFSFNPHASSFSFNACTTSFSPGGERPAPETDPNASEALKQDLPPSKDQAAEGVAKLSVSDSHDATTELTKASEPEPVVATAAQAQQSQPQEPREAEAAADEEEEVEETDEERRKVYEALAREDSRAHMNIVFIGHVDHGKSTLGGQILVLMGGVDERTIEKYQKEAKENNRETWYMAYVMDTNDEERAKGKTVEVGRAYLATEKRRYTILDAPGHKSYVPNMIQGASQADIGVLVISARQNEFETGFERGGQTREHALLAKTLGVQKLIVAVNKMDCVLENGKWSQKRYDDIVSKLKPFLKSCGYNSAKDLVFLPIAALSGDNIVGKCKSDICDWWSGPTLFEALDATEPPRRDPMASFRMPVMDKYKDMGTIVMGKSESGVVQVGHGLVMMPNGTRCKVTGLWRDDDEVQACGPGENIKVRIAGIDEEQVSLGFVLSGPRDRCPVVSKFQCQLQLLELLDHKSIFTAGYKSMLHIHSITEECEVLHLDYELDRKSKAKKQCKFVKSNAVVVCRIGLERGICVETFEHNPQMGRFTLRDEGRTIAIGKVIKLPPSSQPSS